MFQNNRLSVIAYANGFTLWHYVGDEPLAKLLEPGFFNSVNNLAATGDIIILNGTDSTAIKVMTLEGKKITLGPLSD